MIECGGYGFGERVAALLGAAASPQTIAVVQHTLRATNPTGFMQAARFVTGGETPPLGAGLTMPLLLIQGEETSTGDGFIEDGNRLSTVCSSAASARTSVRMA